MSVATIVSFDGTKRCTVPVHYPASRAELVDAVQAHPRLSIRGSGLSYCLAGAAPSTPTLSTRGLDRILDFDEQAGTITVESGCTIGALLRHAVDHGFWFPALPGHPEISVGGCAAFNTHGKTQHDVGQFSDHIVGLTLLHPDHGVVECSSTSNPELFELTVGGMGLTGWILQLTIGLQRLAGASIRRKAHRANDLVHAVELMEANDRPGTHLYSWNDANRRGDGFGRGVVYEESFVDEGDPGRPRFRQLTAERRGRLVPVPAWNRITTTLANRAFYHFETRRRIRTLGALDAAFPINGKEGYFHAFGRRGLLEYQIIVPRNSWADAVDRVRQRIEARRACITLSSLKLFRGKPRHLWFRGDGVCLTLDGPATAATTRLFADLDRMAVELGATVNLAKDSRIDRDTTEQIFPGYREFAAALAAHDPERRIDSELRRRIGV